MVALDISHASRNRRRAARRREKCPFPNARVNQIAGDGRDVQIEKLPLSRRIDLVAARGGQAHLEQGWLCGRAVRSAAQRDLPQMRGVTP